MNIEINELEYCKINVKYTADPEIVKNKYNEAINQLRKLPVPGFRPGKATDQAIKIKYKDRIKNWVKQEMVSNAHDDILFETKIRPVGTGQVGEVKLEKNSFFCDITFLKKPEFDLKDVKGLEVPKPHVEVSSAQISEAYIQNLRMHYADFKPYDENDFVQNSGDKVTMDVVVSIDGKKIDDLSQEGKLYVVGSKLFPDFDDNIIGMKAGESRDFSVVLEKSVLPSLDGKKVNVAVTVHMGMKTMPHALNDELAKKCGYENYDQLRAAIDGMATVEVENSEKRQIADQLKKQLIAMHDFETPGWLNNMEAQQLAQNQNIKWEEASDEVKNHLIDSAKNNVKFSLILDSIQTDIPEASLTDQELFEITKTKLINSGVKDVNDWLSKNMNSGQLLGLLAGIKNEFAIKYVMDNAKIVE